MWALTCPCLTHKRNARIVVQRTPHVCAAHACGSTCAQVHLGMLTHARSHIYTHTHTLAGGAGGHHPGAAVQCHRVVAGQHHPHQHPGRIQDHLGGGEHMLAHVCVCGCAYVCINAWLLVCGCVYVHVLVCVHVQDRLGGGEHLRAYSEHRHAHTHTGTCTSTHTDRQYPSWPAHHA